jgi:hypothetical protein
MMGWSYGMKGREEMLLSGFILPRRGLVEGSCEHHTKLSLCKILVSEPRGKDVWEKFCDERS